MSAAAPAVLSGHRSCCQLPGRSASEAGCAVHFPAGQGWVLLSGSHYQRCHGFTAKLADVIAAGNLTGGRLHATSVELKSGKFRVEDVRDQLQSAADVLDQILPRKSSYKLRFVAILMHQRVQRPTVVIRQFDLTRNYVKFRGTRSRISLIRCGGELRPSNWDPLTKA